MECRKIIFVEGGTCEKCPFYTMKMTDECFAVAERLFNIDCRGNGHFEYEKQKVAVTFENTKVGDIIFDTNNELKYKVVAIFKEEIKIIGLYNGDIIVKNIEGDVEKINHFFGRCRNFYKEI